MSSPSNLYGRTWSDGEYLVVLHYYFKYRSETFDANKPFIQELVRILGRTPASIVMRFGNFASLDLNFNSRGKGLVKGGNKCKAIYDQWKNMTGVLETVAEEFIKDFQSREMPLLSEISIKMPKAFGKYEPMDLKGSGAFGVVYSCINVETQQSFAMKIIKVDQTTNNENFHRLKREIHALKSIKHKNIINIYEDNLSTEERIPAFVMDLADESLTEWLEQRFKENPSARPPFEPKEGAEIVRSIIEAVLALHASDKKIIHRDINPNNILRLPNDVWVLADFSLVKYTSSAPASFMTHSSQNGWGTYGYMAPEQYYDFAGSDHRADIYALGVLIWTLFTSDRPPMRPDSFMVPDCLEYVCKKATQKSPNDRFQSVEELKVEFEKAIKNLPPF